MQLVQGRGTVGGEGMWQIPLILCNDLQNNVAGIEIDEEFCQAWNKEDFRLSLTLVEPKLLLDFPVT